MKKNKYMILVLLIGVISSCEDFLKEDSSSLVSTSSYYNTLDEATTALNGSYALLRPIYSSLGVKMSGDMMADVFQPGTGGGGGQQTFDNFTHDAANGVFVDLYFNSYRLINSNNTLISDLEEKEFSNTTLKNKIIGEAKFLRALAYFNLARVFGDVPLITEPSVSSAGLDNPRTPVSEVYDQIIKILDEAINILDEKSLSVGRTNKIAANALMAKVYLTLNNQQKSLTYLNQVIGKRSLYDNFIDNWASANDNNTKESIFEVQYGNPPYNSNFIEYLTSPEVTGSGFMYNVFRVEDKLVKTYDSNDKRLTQGMWDKYNNVKFADGWYVKKYNNKLASGTDRALSNTINFKVMRYSEVLLMYSEVLNAVNNGPTAEALNAVNQVRNRAGIDNLPAGLSKAVFLDAVVKERYKEFAGEGQRWFDLKRLGRLNDELAPKGFISGKNELWPIPQSARDANPNLIQNPGY